MLQTDDDRGSVNAHADLDTLSAEDALPDANLDDRLLRRDLKSRIFGASTTVQIGRYEILRRIGRGGMGTVYVAHDPELDRKVALKVLRPDRRSGRDRMLHEARALARLAHPNVVTVHEVGLHDERVFVAMELVEGRTLRAWLEQGPDRNELYGVFLQAAQGLHAAHQAGLVHRDFKPENVLIGDDDRVRVVDFGVVKATDSLDADDLAEGGGQPTTESMPELTHTGQLLGTPAYMAAEQFLGASVDARTDVFAFCASLYEALTGHRPFPGDDALAVSRAVLEGTFAPLPSSTVPASLARLIEQGLSRQADERPPSMDGLASALRAAMRPAAERPRRRWVAGLSAASLGLILVGTAVSMVSEPPPSVPTHAAAVVEASGEEADDEGPEGPDLQQQAIDTAFAAVTSAPDDARRLTAAERFLEAYGETAAPTRRAIAHSIVGDAQWRASCPGALRGLCVEELDSAPGNSRCHAPLRGTLVPQPRDSELSHDAIAHLDAALALSGVEPPTDPEARALFGASIGRAQVQRTDAKLEAYMNIELPRGLDFMGDSPAKSMSTDAFKLYYRQMITTADELARGYAKVKKAGDVPWVLTAADRSGMVSEIFAEGLEGTMLAQRSSDRVHRAYCKAMNEFTSPRYRMAHGAYTYCLEKASKNDIEGPRVEHCRDRLAILDRDEYRDVVRPAE